MIVQLLKRLSGKTDTDAVAIDPEHELKVSAVALLIEVAKADHHLSDHEEAKLIELVTQMFDLTADEQAELVQSAKDKSESATSLYEYTSVINTHYSESEKFQLVTCMWKLAFSDQTIDRYEEHLIRRVADLIYLPHVKFIEAKHIASDA